MSLIDGEQRHQTIALDVLSVERRPMGRGRNDPCPCGSGRKYKNCCLGSNNGGLLPSDAAAISSVSGNPRQLVAMYRAARFGELESCLRVLLEHSPQSGFLWGLLGATLQAQGRDGLLALQRATFLLPRDFDAQTGLGVAFRQRGRLAEAADSFRRALALQPLDPGAQFNLGDALRMLGRFAEAEAYLRRFLAGVPDSLDGLVSLALTLGELGTLGEAEALCRRALQLAPGGAAAQFCLGNILVRSARLDEAKNCFLAALQADPTWVPALESLGNVLQELGSLAQAEASYRRCLELSPGLANACANLGRLFVEQNRFGEAEACYRDALKTEPDNAGIHERLGSVLLELGRSGEAKNCYLQALRVQPERVSARLALATVDLPVITQTVEEAAAVPGLFASALEELAGWLHSDPERKVAAGDLAVAQQPFFLAYRDGNHVGLLSRYADLVGECLHSRACTSRPHRARIRLVIVSHQVRWHSVWNIVLRGLLLHLDRSRFEVLLYHLGNAEDGETAFARSQVDGWRDRHTITDAAGWLAAAENDCPDVIFYPEIGMSSMAYFLAAQRLAPLQVASWGHPITTGLATIDLFLSGELLEAPDADAHYRERLIRLPGTGCCTSALPLIGEPIPEVEKSLAGMDGTRFVIAQRAIKFDPVADDSYAKIAVATGASVFILLRDPVCPWATDLIKARLESTFRSHGLDPGRHLVEIPWLSPGKFLALLDICDVYLDCTGFSGYTTAWLALHRGLPIVALEGRYMRQRLAAGLLRKAGLADTIALSVEDYVAIAARLAAECRYPDRKEALRAAVLAAAPSVDGDVHVVRSFEQCLTTALEACAPRR